MMTVMISKWVGDLFNISLYDIHVELLCIPFVESTPPQRHTLMTAADVRCPAPANASVPSPQYLRLRMPSVPLPQYRSFSVLFSSLLFVPR